MRISLTGHCCFQKQRFLLCAGSLIETSTADYAEQMDKTALSSPENGLLIAMGLVKAHLPDSRQRVLTLKENEAAPDRSEPARA